MIYKFSICVFFMVIWICSLCNLVLFNKKRSQIWRARAIQNSSRVKICFYSLRLWLSKCVYWECVVVTENSRNHNWSWGCCLSCCRNCIDNGTSNNFEFHRNLQTSSITRCRWINIRCWSRHRNYSVLIACDWYLLGLFTMGARRLCIHHSRCHEFAFDSRKWRLFLSHSSKYHTKISDWAKFKFPSIRYFIFYNYLMNNFSPFGRYSVVVINSFHCDSIWMALWMEFGDSRLYDDSIANFFNNEWLYLRLDEPPSWTALSKSGWSQRSPTSISFNAKNSCSKHFRPS